MDLVRTILIQLVEQPSDHVLSELRVEGHSNEEVSYHVRIMYERGLLEAENASHNEATCWIPTHVTWEGQEFLASARDETIWNRAKGIVNKSTGALAFEALKIALAAVIKQAITSTA
jgi:predicted transcriptional regulator